MSAWAVAMLVRLNSGRAPGGRGRDASPAAYARWEWTEGERVFRKCYAGQVDLAGKRVLDLACGLGGKTAYLATLGPASVTGLDFNPTHVAQARDFCESALRAGEIATGVPVTILKADAARIPVGEGSYDIVITSDSMEHFNEPGAVLKEVHRVLAPGGLLLLDFAPWRSKYGPHLNRWVRTPWAHLFTTEEELEDACRRIATRQMARIKDRAERDQLEAKLESDLEQYYEGLNHISLRQLFELLADNGPWTIRHRKITGAYPWAWPLAQLKADAFVGRLALVLERRDSVERG